MSPFQVRGKSNEWHGFSCRVNLTVSTLFIISIQSHNNTNLWLKTFLNFNEMLLRWNRKSRSHESATMTYSSGSCTMAINMLDWVSTNYHPFLPIRPSHHQPQTPQPKKTLRWRKRVTGLRLADGFRHTMIFFVAPFKSIIGPTSGLWDGDDDEEKHEGVSAPSQKRAYVIGRGSLSSNMFHRCVLLFSKNGSRDSIFFLILCHSSTFHTHALQYHITISL